MPKEAAFCCPRRSLAKRHLRAPSLPDSEQRFLKRGGAYERLRDDEYLKLVRIIDGGMALGWPDGQEVYPEALFAMSERVR